MRPREIANLLRLDVGELHPWRARAAEHEAGHAIVARAFGCRVGALVLGEDESETSACVFFDRGRLTNRSSALIALAGPGTEVLSTSVAVCSTGAGRDLREAWAVLADQAPDEEQRARLLRRLFRDVQEILVENWAHVQVLAALLLEANDGQLDADAVREVLG